MEAGGKGEAKKIWNGALNAAPTHPPTLFYSGLLASQEGRMPDARRNLDVLFKATPADNLYLAPGRDLLGNIENAPAAAVAQTAFASAPYDAAQPWH